MELGLTFPLQRFLDHAVNTCLGRCAGFSGQGRCLDGMSEMLSG